MCSEHLKKKFDVKTCISLNVERYPVRKLLIFFKYLKSKLFLVLAQFDIHNWKRKIPYECFWPSEQKMCERRYRIWQKEKQYRTNATF